MCNHTIQFTELPLPAPTAPLLLVALASGNWAKFGSKESDKQISIFNFFDAVNPMVWDNPPRKLQNKGFCPYDALELKCIKFISVPLHPPDPYYLV